MIKRLTILLLLLSGWLVTYGQTGRSSGLTIYGGKDMVSYDMVPPSAGLPPFDTGKTYFDSRFSLGFGYRWRLKPIDSRWFFDLAIIAGYHRYKYGLSYLSPDEHITYAGNTGVCNLLSVSLSGSVGYYLYKGLNLSVGVESAYYFYDKDFVNVPVFARLGYDLVVWKLPYNISGE